VQGDRLAGLGVAQGLPADGVELRGGKVEAQAQLEVAAGGVGPRLEPGLAQRRGGEELGGQLRPVGGGVVAERQQFRRIESNRRIRGELRWGGTGRAGQRGVGDHAGVGEAADVQLDGGQWHGAR
jgi:hypothetical protein